MGELQSRRILAMDGKQSLALAVFMLIAPVTLGQSPCGEEQPSEPILQNCTVLESCPCAEVPNRFWGGAEYLLWWVKDGPTPGPLVTTGNPTDVVPGALGQPGTQPLFGGNGLAYGAFSGIRATLGGWFDDEHIFGVEASGFVLEQRRTGFAASSDNLGNPPLYVPFFNVATGQPGSFTIADPLFGAAGKVAISSSSRLWGMEGNGYCNLARTDSLAFDVLVGYRYLSLREDLNLTAVSTDLGTGLQTVLADQFATHSQFNGGQLGARLEWQREQLALELSGKLAMGVNHDVADINGATVATPPGGPPATFANGILTAPSNRGSQNSDRFSLVPQVGVKLGWNVTPWLRATVGYDFVYWTEVARPGQQIDVRVNPTQYFGGTLTGPALPAPLLNHTDFWAQGLNFGLALTF
jgi:hypothetical protein